MPRFERGAVVARGKRFGVVWLDDETGLILFPVERGDARPHDVLIEDTISCGFAMLDARLRTRHQAVGRRGQEQVGIVPAPLWCQIAHAMLRQAHDDATIAKWAAADIHRRRAAENLPASR